MRKENGMIQHFTFKPVRTDGSFRRSYRISFYHEGTCFRAVYRYNGQIDWKDPKPEVSKRKTLESHIHELMLFHVYDK
ncbi:MAG TPA: DUF5342 family protein [Bacillales bacterium]|nr:DUF5342 family protein [Bacillales bacterium]